jgi:ABC-type Fe3+ transport system substrate-binding protein
MYTQGTPDPEVQKFLDYMLEDEVQNGPVVELGYLPITDMTVERDGKWKRNAKRIIYKINTKTAAEVGFRRGFLCFFFRQLLVLVRQCDFKS